MADHAPNQLQALLPQEQQALEQGTNMWRASVSEELGILLAGLGVDQASISHALLTTAHEARQQSMLDAKTTAESIRDARVLLLGVTVTNWAARISEPAVTSNENTAEVTHSSEVAPEVTVSKDAAPQEATIHADTANDVSAAEADDTEQNTPTSDITKEVIPYEIADSEADANKETEETEETELISEAAFRKLLTFFGEENADLLQNCTVAQAETYIETIVAVLISKRLMRASFKEMRLEQWHERIIHDKPWNTFEGKIDTVTKAYSYAKIAFTRKLTSQERRQLLLAPQALAPEHSQLQTGDSAVKEAFQETPLEFYVPEVITDKLLQKAKTLVADIYGNHAPKKLNDLTFEMCVQMISESLAIVAKHADGRSSHNLDLKKQILLELLYTSNGNTIISRKLNKSDTYVTNVIRPFFITVQKTVTGLKAPGIISALVGTTPRTARNKTETTTQEVAKATPEIISGIGTTALPREIEYVGIVEEENSIPSQTQDETQEDSISNKKVASEDAFEAIAAVLYYTDEMTFKLLKSLFDITRTRPDYSVEAGAIYEDLDAVLSGVKDNKQYKKFTDSLEYKALCLLVKGTPDLKPLAPASVQGKLAKELTDSKRKFNEVVQSGLLQLAEIRQEVMGSHSAL